MQVSDRGFDEVAPEADEVEQHTPVGIDDEEDALESARVWISPSDDANEADLIEQAMVVPVEDDLEFDR